MKKFLLAVIALLGLAAADVNAQIISYSQTKITKSQKQGFQQVAEILGGLELEEQPLACIQYIAGYRFNNTVFVGGGIGGGYAQAQIFANAKFYFTSTRVQPTAELSVGGAFGNEEGLDALITPHLGINITTSSRLNYHFSIGVQILPIYAAVYPSLKIGVSF